MYKYKRILSVIFALVIFACSCFITVSAEGTVNIVGDNVAIRAASNTSSAVLGRVSWTTVTLNFKETGERVDAEGKTDNVWYNITCGNVTGFVCGIYVTIPPEYVYDADFEKNLQNFPESYWESLRKLHAKYPNWQFIAHDVGITFTDAVNAQYGVDDYTKTRKWVEFTFGGNEWRDMRGYDAATNIWATLEGRWTYASRAAIENYMDPRTSLDERNIFVFMQQGFDAASQTKENLRTVVAGTFLANGYDNNADAYLDDIMAASTESGVNPYVLAATIIVEQGQNGSSGLISGTYAGYEGYYNFFNFAAAGSDIVGSGLSYAKSQGWNTRRASIIGGAKLYSDGYIAVGQDTYYYKDFDVVNKRWNHQYASALYDAWTNAYRLQPVCVSNTNATLTFKIPVFKDMPQNLCPTPTATVGQPVEPAPTASKGDTNADGVINVVDLAAIKMHILGVKALEGASATAGDTNGDGAINVVDLAAVKMHILGVKQI